MSRKTEGDGNRMKDIMKIAVGYVRVSTPGQGGKRTFAADCAKFCYADKATVRCSR